jgi:hypothetical protein
VAGRRRRRRRPRHSVERGARRPDLLITDVGHAPAGRPRARCGALRERWPDLPTLFLSGAGSGTGAAGPLLAKPFDHDRLRRTVATLLREAPA